MSAARPAETMVGLVASPVRLAGGGGGVKLMDARSGDVVAIRLSVAEWRRMLPVIERLCAAAETMFPGEDATDA